MTNQAFTEQIRHFAVWARHGNLSEPGAIAAALSYLSTLYSSYFTLGGYVDAEVDAPEPHLSSDEWQQVFDNASGLPFSMYSCVADPHQVPPTDDPVIGDIRDDLADIYRDLVSGLRLYEAGFPLAARSQWSLLLFHWGEHVVNALSVLHAHLQENRIVGVPEA